MILTDILVVLLCCVVVGKRASVALNKCGVLLKKHQGCINVFFSGDSMIWKARNFGDNDLYQNAQKIKMPACETLQNLKNRGSL